MRVEALPKPYDSYDSTTSVPLREPNAPFRIPRALHTFMLSGDNYLVIAL